MPDADPADPDGVTAALLAREPLFHRAAPGAGRAEFAAMTTPDFWEVGASGRVHDRDVVLDVLAERHGGTARPEEEWTVSEPRSRHLGGDCWLFTYRLDLDGRRTRRATIWERSSDGTWLVVYHQGTPAA